MWKSNGIAWWGNYIWSGNEYLFLLLPFGLPGLTRAETFPGPRDMVGRMNFQDASRYTSDYGYASGWDSGYKKCSRWFRFPLFVKHNFHKIRKNITGWPQHAACTTLCHFYLTRWLKMWLYKIKGNFIGKILQLGLFHAEIISGSAIFTHTIRHSAVRCRILC